MIGRLKDMALASIESGRVHDLKSHPAPFEAVREGIKLFEFRRDDRGYQVGDVLRLREWQPNANHTDGGFYLDGEPILCLVTYILREGYGMPPGFVVLSIRVLS